MPIELDHPVIAEIDKKEVEIDTSKMKRLWDVADAANLQINTAGSDQFPRGNQLNDIQKTKLNKRIKIALENQSAVVIHYGTFAIILDSTQSAYYQIDDTEARKVISGKQSSLKAPALSGKLSANISFDSSSAWINIYLNQHGFSHILYEPNHPNDIPLIYEVPTSQNPPIVLFGFNPNSKESLFIEKSVA